MNLHDWVPHPRVALDKGEGVVKHENPTWDDLAADWGKPIAPLKPTVAEGKADPSVAMAPEG